MKKTLLLIPILLGSFLSAGELDKCTGCHGKIFEKAALGKSKIVKDMSEEDIFKALIGYKEGTYGGSMKGLMKGQVMSLSDLNSSAKEIKSISETGTEVKKEKPLKKEKCLKKIDSIKKCFIDAKTQNEMQSCRKDLINFSVKVKSKHNIK